MHYAIETTLSIKNNPYILMTLAAGDVIETAGYYAANDGGAGKFIVRAAETGETADNTFTYNLYNNLNNNLIAELQIPNGVVNIDQLGARGNGWVDNRIYGDSIDSTTVTSITDAMAQNNHENDSINWEKITDAVDRYGIREVQYSAGKIYPICAIELYDLSGLTINGNGAILIDDPNDFQNPRFSCYDSTGIIFRNIQFTRILPPLYSTLYMEGCSHITLDNVQFVFGGNALEIVDCSHVRMHNVRAHACASLLSAYNLTYGSLTDADFSVTLVRSGIDHVLAFSGNTAYCLLQNISLTDVQTSDAIYMQNTNNNMFCDILVQTANNGLTILNSSDTNIHDVVVKNADTALKVSDTQNVRFSHCLFGGKAQQPLQNTNPVPLVDLGTACNEDLHFCGCTLHAPCVWFRVAGRAVSGDNVTFADCRFYVDAEPADTLYVPASFASPLSFMHFDSCTFETSGFPQSMAGNEQFFALSGTSGTNSLAAFASCRFRNGGTEANSPIRVDAQNRADLHVLVKDCLLEGFRWTTRISSANESQAGVTTTTVNPAFSAWPDSTTKADAIAAMDDIASFGATGNLYFRTSAVTAPYYLAGEQYSVALIVLEEY